MADSGIKKTIIKKENLPAVDLYENGYIFRYRVISEDKNRLSHWSPITIVSPGYTYQSGNISHNKNGDINTIVWDSVSITKDSNLIENASAYDIWVKWDKDDGGDWSYKGRLNSTNISLITPTDYFIAGVSQGDAPNRLSIEVFLLGSPISRSITTLRVYEGGPWTV